ncbi:hypothetical protein BDR26DRAFT_854541 [Obelidium mucronatum]|nr:hypothetical protein BDR26DRAFT_854541 [Obelidium mucronatum]
MSSAIQVNAYGSNCGIALQPTFNACITNQLTSTSAVTFLSVETFCSQYQTVSQLVWYQCLCETSARVVNCFQTSCPNDTGASQSAQGSHNSYCQAADAYKPATSNVGVISTAVVDGVATLPPAPADPADTGKARASGARGAFFSFYFIFVLAALL